MWMETLKVYFIDYAIAIVLEIALYSFFGMAGLVIGLGLIILYRIDAQVNYLRKMIKSYQILNEARIVSLMNKLKVSSNDAKKILDEMKEKVSKEQWEQVEKGNQTRTKYS